MDERQKIREELQELEAKQLHAAHGQVPKWELPSDYMAGLTDRVVESTAHAGARYRRMVIIRWAAAAAIVLVASYWWFQTPTVDHKPPLAVMDWNDIPTEDIQQYVSENIDEFDFDLLANSVAEGADPDEMEGVSPAETISTEALEDFLEAEEEWLDDLNEEDWF